MKKDAKISASGHTQSQTKSKALHNLRSKLRFLLEKLCTNSQKGIDNSNDFNTFLCKCEVYEFIKNKITFAIAKFKLTNTHFRVIIIKR